MGIRQYSDIPSKVVRKRGAREESTLSPSLIMSENPHKDGGFAQKEITPPHFSGENITIVIEKVGSGSV